MLEQLGLVVDPALDRLLALREQLVVRLQYDERKTRRVHRGGERRVVRSDVSQLPVLLQADERRHHDVRLHGPHLDALVRDHRVGVQRDASELVPMTKVQPPASSSHRSDYAPLRPD